MKPPITVDYDKKNNALVILDQTKLPGETVYLSLTKEDEIIDAIRALKVRGAPAIGVAAAIGLYVLSSQIVYADKADFLAQFHAVKARLAKARPTAVNLTWALERMEGKVETISTETPEEMLDLLRQEALTILEEDRTVCEKIGSYGQDLLKDGDGVLTHCNAGKLATAGLGTALAPVYAAHSAGKSLRVFADETRPLLQGARLTAYELMASGITPTVLCDNMASSAMQQGWIQAVLVGCDRVAANGDTANKIGTSGVAILARHYGIPFYVCAPLSTIDFDCPDGSYIPIEQREPEEITSLWYEKPMTPSGIQVYNPAFDVTDASLITAFITEYGVIRPPYSETFAALKKRAVSIDTLQ